MVSRMGLLTKKDFLDDQYGKQYQELIEGFDKKQLTPAGYDFRPAECINLTTRERVKLTGGNKYKIRHGDFVIIYTREILRLGSTKLEIFGQVYSKVSFVLRGLSHVGTKIDPGFEGSLALTFKNDGYDIIEITEDTSICNVALQVIPETGGRYTPRSFDYPALTMKPSLSFPLTPEHWEEYSQWYTREAFETYLQWSNELSALSIKIAEQQKELKTSLTDSLTKSESGLTDRLAKEIESIRSKYERFQEEATQSLDRAERMYNGAILTTFVAAIAVVSVLLAAAALFFNQLKVPLGSTWLSVFGICAAIGVFIFVFLSVRKMLTSQPQRRQKTAPSSQGKA